MNQYNSFIIRLGNLLVFGLLLVSCSDDLFDGNRNEVNGPTVSFDVTQVQDNMTRRRAASVPMTRAAFAAQLSELNLSTADLPVRQIKCEGVVNTCLIQTTTAGIQDLNNMASESLTRANITTMKTLQQFSTLGFRGDAEENIDTPWFANEKTNPDGKIVNPVPWNWSYRWGQFYAVYPLVTDAYGKLKLSPQSQRQPSVDFEVERDVKNQKDLMTATTKPIWYETHNVAPTIPLAFTHALTAVRFKVGSNLSYNKTITKVEIINAMSKGHYTLPGDPHGSGTWSDLSTPATFTLDGINVNTAKEKNVLLTGEGEDNFTFYMLPQTLKDVSMKVSFDDNTSISAKLGGIWRAGTTVQYGLSEKQSTWEYHITGNNCTAAYNAASAEFSIQSYRQSPDGIQQAVPWKVVGYDANGDDKFSMDEKPDWVESSKVCQGSGSTNFEKASVGLHYDVIDFEDCFWAEDERGSEASRYDLSLHDYKGNETKRNTANCYLISALGYYRLPLVYGNAIKNGEANPSAYQAKEWQTGSGYEERFKRSYFLSKFTNHLGNEITDPWLRNNGVKPDGAKIVWADTNDSNGKPIVTNLKISGDYLEFDVDDNSFENGNVVIAATQNGTVVWSWHLWFTDPWSLNTVEVTNKDGVKYKMAQAPLGMKYIRSDQDDWTMTYFTSPRSVRVKVEQDVKNNGEKQTSIFTITQNNGFRGDGFATFYQWGRKDAMPGTSALAAGTFSSSGEKFNVIEHPELFWLRDSRDEYECPLRYINLWSMDNTSFVANDEPVVKTIYDPCPVGFHVPGANAFTGFSSTDDYNGGESIQPESNFNVVGKWDNGWNFKTGNSTTPTIFFPAFGFIQRADATINAVGKYGDYWTAARKNEEDAYTLSFLYDSYNRRVYRKCPQSIRFGHVIRPVAE